MGLGAGWKFRLQPTGLHMRIPHVCVLRRQGLQPSRCAAFRSWGLQKRSLTEGRILKTCDSQKLSLSPKIRDQVEDKGKDDTKNNATREREVQGCVFAAVGDVSRQTAQGNAALAEQKNQAAQEEQKQSDTYEQATKVIHTRSVEQRCSR